MGSSMYGDDDSSAGRRSPTKSLEAEVTMDNPEKPRSGVQVRLDPDNIQTIQNLYGNKNVNISIRKLPTNSRTDPDSITSTIIAAINI
ncbi:hypothetical protein Zmor_014990 [Zophobas morio]|uniref:Uncharacterized protein n=1 Tax=Zophobas morio TaxID=2755281 RepID=A0AA38MGU9_9CUCU|nr:hypothetical protein Zmor_014990 [Zophobas morio]